MRITTLDLRMIEMEVGRGCQASVEWLCDRLSVSVEVRHNGETHGLQRIFAPAELRSLKNPQDVLPQFAKEAKAQFDNCFKEAP